MSEIRNLNELSTLFDTRDTHLPEPNDIKELHSTKSIEENKDNTHMTLEECNDFWNKFDYDSIRKNIEKDKESSLINSKDTIAEKANISESIETDEPREKKGGSYRDVKKTSDSDKHEVHHMPADSSTDLDRDDGPAIKMEKEDHRQTASCGNSKEAREYRERQRELINQGKFREALQMDIDDIREKFGDKYDDAIDEMLDYVDQLEKEGKING